MSRHYLGMSRDYEKKGDRPWLGSEVELEWFIGIFLHFDD